VVKKVESILVEGAKKVEMAEQGKTWEEVNTPLDWIGKEITKIYGVASHLNSVCYNEKESDEFEKTIPMVSDFYNKMGTNKALYDAFKALGNNDDLDESQKHILSEGLKGFYLGGIELSPRGQKILSGINQKLGLLNNNFSKNVIMSVNEWSMDVTEDQLVGVSDQGKLKFKNEDAEGYSINLQMPSYMEAMTYIDDEDVRKSVYMAHITRASDMGITSKKLDNTSNMDEILKLRMEKANLLEFKNYAEMSIFSKMVENADVAIEFLEGLVEKARPQAENELKELEDFAGKKLNPWDLTYYANKLKESKYGFKKEDLTPYFPESKVMNGLFRQIEKLYGFKFVEIDETTYHKDVKVMELVDSDNNLVGKLYFDPYARENKRGGAWMDDYQGLDGDEKPIAYVVCNFNKPIGGDEAYFEFDEIVTLFHEFGHALHHLLTTCEYPGVAGISGVPWDGVELPSQYMENYAYEKDVALGMSKHKESGDVIPDALYDKLIESKNFQSALGMLRQCEFSLWDLKVHMSKLDAYEVLREVEEMTSLMPKLKENKFLNSFSHVFAGGYAAGYYSYKWAEVLSSDAYNYVKEVEGASNDFKRYILEVGGGHDFMDQYIKFRGRNPSIDSLLENNGINIIVNK
jgi:oligopeptidase A